MKYVAQGFGKEGKLLKEALKVVPEEEMFKLIDKFFQMNDNFVKSSGYTIGVFVSQINKLRTSKGSKLYV